MAKKVQNTRKSFYEVVFQGKPKVVKAYLAGLVAGGGYDAEIFFNFAEGVFHEGKVEHLKELLHVRALDCHVIVDRETSNRLKKLARKLPGTADLVITSHRSIRNASLEFNYQAFARRYDDEITGILKDLPDGLRLKGYKREVKENPEARGVEAYAPAHHFEAEGHGTIVGSIDQVIACKRVLDGVALINAEEVTLNLA